MSKPIIDVAEKFSVSELAQEAVSALLQWNDPPTLFQNHDTLVEFRNGELNQVSQAGLSAMLHEAASFVRVKESGLVPVRRIDEISQHVFHYTWRRSDFPRIDAIITAPALGSDGNLIVKPGYHQDSCIYFHSGCNWPISDATAAESLAWLYLELFSDFPFESDGDKANAMAMVLHPFVSAYTRGPAPLFCWEAPERSSGKSLGMCLCLIPGIGHEPDPQALLPTNNEEFDKLKGSLVLTKTPYALFDNVEGKIRGSSLAATITSSSLTGRILGQSGTYKGKNNICWALSANNADLDEDLVRRTLAIRLDANMEDPRTRDSRKFRHPEIKKWVVEHRVVVVGHLLNLLQKWIEAGRPDWSGLPIASFESWSCVTGGILENAGESNFAKNIAAGKAEPTEFDHQVTAFWKAIFANHSVHRFKAGMVKDLIAGFPLIQEYATRNGSEGHAIASRIGYHLKRYCGKVRGGLKLTNDGYESGSTSYRFVHEPSLTPTALVGSNQGGYGGYGGLEESKHVRACAQVKGEPDPTNSPKSPNPHGLNLNETSPDERVDGGLSEIVEVSV